MEIFSEANLKELVSYRDKRPCVSLYIPTLRAWPPAEQNEIRFKDVLQAAGGQLAAAGLRDTAISKLLEPARRLVSDRGFWQSQGDGLAMFLAPGFERYYRVPISLPEIAVVTNRFHLKPLLPLLTDGQFLVLALSLKQVRLIQGTPQSVREVPIPNAPHSLEECVYKYIITPERLPDDYAGVSAQARAKGIGVMHSHAVDENEVKQRIWEYCRDVDKALHEPLRNQRVPLVLAGVDYILPMFRDASAYQHIVKESIVGNPDDTKDDELRQQAWKIVRPVFDKRVQAAAERYGDLSGTAKASADPKDVVAAAYFGRVYQLFVATGKQQWGAFNPETMEVEVHDHPDAVPGDEDLLDFAAIHTLINDGEVFAVEPERVPGQALVAAVFRY